MNVRTADSGVSDANIDISLFPLLGLVLLPDHVALGGLFVLTHPSLKLVVGAHFGGDFLLFFESFFFLMKQCTI